MSKLFHKGPCGCRLLFQLLSQPIGVLRQLITPNVCSSVVGTNTCTHTALCGIDWRSLD